MNDEAMVVLLEALGQILENQIKIMERLGIENQYDAYHGESNTSVRCDACYDLSTKYEHE